jgi:hypothetical protein
MNSVHLAGPLVADPIKTEKGAVLCRVRCRDLYGNKTVFGFACYGKTGENLVKHCHAGKWVTLVEAMLCSFTEMVNGKRKFRVSVKATKVEYGPDSSSFRDPSEPTCGECDKFKDNDCYTDDNKKVTFGTTCCQEFVEKEVEEDKTVTIEAD